MPEHAGKVKNFVYGIMIPLVALLPHRRDGCIIRHFGTVAKGHLTGIGRKVFPKLDRICRGNGWRRGRYVGTAVKGIQKHRATIRIRHPRQIPDTIFDRG